MPVQPFSISSSPVLTGTPGATPPRSPQQEALAVSQPHVPAVVRMQGSLLQQQDGQYAFQFNNGPAKGLAARFSKKAQAELETQSKKGTVPAIGTPMIVDVDIHTGRARTDSGLALNTVGFMKTSLMQGLFGHSASFVDFALHHYQSAPGAPSARAGQLAQVRALRQHLQQHCRPTLGPLPPGAVLLRWPGDRGNHFTVVPDTARKNRSTLTIDGTRWEIAFNKAAGAWELCVLQDQGMYDGLSGGTPPWPEALPGHDTWQGLLPPSVPPLRSAAYSDLTAALQGERANATVVADSTLPAGTTALLYATRLRALGQTAQVGVRLETDARGRICRICVDNAPSGPIDVRYDWDKARWNNKRSASPGAELPGGRHGWPVNETAGPGEFLGQDDLSTMDLSSNTFFSNAFSFTELLDGDLPLDSALSSIQPALIHPQSRSQIVTSHTDPLYLEDQRATAFNIQMGDTCGAHTVNQVFQGPVVSPGALPRTTLDAIGNQITAIGGITTTHYLVHPRMLQPGQTYQSLRNELAGRLNRFGVAPVEIGRNANIHANSNEVQTHFVTLFRVADGQTGIRGGIYLLDSVMPHPVWFADANAAFTAIEQVTRQREGQAHVSARALDALPAMAPGAAGKMVEHRGYVLLTPPSQPLVVSNPQEWITHWTPARTTPSTSASTSSASSSAGQTSRIRPPSPVSGPRPGVNQVETRWLASFLGGIPTPAPLPDIEAALYNAPPNAPLVDHYALVLREQAGVLARTRHIPQGDRDHLERFVRRFEEHARQNQLLVTGNRVTGQGSQPETRLLVRRDDLQEKMSGDKGKKPEGKGKKPIVQWEMLGVDGRPASPPVLGTLLALLGTALQNADADGLRILRRAPSDQDWLAWGKDRNEPDHLDAKNDIKPGRALVQHLETRGVDPASLGLKHGWPLGPTDQDLEAVLQSMIARGAIIHQDVIDDFHAHLDAANAARAGWHAELVTARDQLRQAQARLRGGDAEATPKVVFLENEILRLHEKIELGHRDLLTDLLYASCQWNPQDELALTLDLNELTLLLPSHRVASTLEAAVPAPNDDDAARSTKKKPVKERAGSVSVPKRKPINPVVEHTKRSRQLPGLVLRNSPRPPGAAWDGVQFTGGAGRINDYQPHTALGRALLREYRVYLDGLVTNRQIQEAMSNNYFGGAQRLHRCLDERSAPTAPPPLDTDDGLLRVTKAIDLLDLSENDKGLLASHAGYLGWLADHLDAIRDDVRARGGAVPARPQASLRRFMPLTMPKDCNKLPPDYQDVARRGLTHLSNANLYFRDRPPVILHTLEVQMANYVYFLAELSHGRVRVAPEHIDSQTALPDGDVFRALRAFGGQPTGIPADDRRTLRRMALQAPQASLAVSEAVFRQLPTSLQNLAANLVMEQAEAADAQGTARKKNPCSSLRTALNNIYDLNLAGTLVLNPPRLEVHRALLERFDRSEHNDNPVMRSYLARWIDAVETSWPIERLTLADYAGSDSATRTTLLPQELHDRLGLNDSRRKKTFETLTDWLQNETRTPDGRRQSWLDDLPTLSATARRIALWTSWFERDDERAAAATLLNEWAEVHEAPVNLIDLCDAHLCEAFAQAASADQLIGWIEGVFLNRPLTNTEKQVIRRLHDAFHPQQPVLSQ